MYAWSVSQDLVDRTLSGKDVDGFFDHSDVGPFDDSVVDHFDLMVILADNDVGNLYENEAPP